MIRINKYISMSGVTSRRGAETLITEKRVTINNKLVEKMGTLVDENNDVVKVDGVVIAPVEQQIYIVFNKPVSVMTTLHDPFKRKTVKHFLKDLPVRVYPVGRLDFDTEGVLILTNDGELAYRLAHPKFGVKKIYEAVVSGNFTPIAAETIQKGVRLEDGAIGRGEVKILHRKNNTTKIRLTLTEGRKREVKQLCKASGHPVKKLRRVEFAGINTIGMKLGKWRYLTSQEIEKLKSSS